MGDRLRHFEVEDLGQLAAASRRSAMPGSFLTDELA
jgi:hypothetical protein